MGLNTWCSDINVNFKSSSIGGTFKFCTVLVALCALEPKSLEKRI